MLKLIVDAEAIAAQFKEFAKEVQADMQKAMGELATLTRAQIAHSVKVKQGGQQAEVHLEHLHEEKNLSGTLQRPLSGVWTITPWTSLLCGLKRA